MRRFRYVLVATAVALVSLPAVAQAVEPLSHPTALAVFRAENSDEAGTGSGFRLVGFGGEAPSGFSLPKDMLPAHQTALRTYLQSRPQLRIARTADYPAWEENKRYIWSSYANRNPYYVSADIDRDGVTDFAVVLVNDRVKVAPNNPFGFSCSLVVFKGSKDGSYREALFKANMGSPEGSLLFYDRASNSLAIGLWEGGISQIQVTRGGQFRYVQ